MKYRNILLQNEKCIFPSICPLTGKTCVSLNSVQELAASDLFHMFTQSIKF